MVGCLCILEEAHTDSCAILVPECAVAFEAGLLLQLGQELGFDRPLDGALAYADVGIATQVEIHETLPFQRHRTGAAGRQIFSPGETADRRRLRAPCQDRAGYILSLLSAHYATSASGFVRLGRHVDGAVQGIWKLGVQSRGMRLRFKPWPQAAVPNQAPPLCRTYARLPLFGRPDVPEGTEQGEVVHDLQHPAGDQRQVLVPCCEERPG